MTQAKQADGTWTQAELTELMLATLQPKLQRAGLAAGTLGPDDDLYASGVIDSFDLVEVLADVEERTGLSARLVIDPDAGAFTLSLRQLVQAFGVRP